MREARDAGLETIKEGARDRFDKVVGGLAVGTAALAAVVGVLVAVSSNKADQASSEALHHALAAGRQSDRALQSVDRGLGLLEQQNTKLAIARVAEEAKLLAQGKVAPATSNEERRARRLANDVDRWLSAARSDRHPAWRGLAADGDDLPENDRYFPQQARVKAKESGIQEIALRDAWNSRLAYWEKRNASYVAILTLLAVALYLFTFALAPQGRKLRGLFASVGLVFLVLCGLFGPVRLASAPPSTTEDAADAYAEGYIALSTASGPGESRSSLDDFTRAIEERPDFTEAYLARADAMFAANAPPGQASITRPRALKRVINDLRMAHALGARTARVATGLGFYLFLLGLLEEDEDLIDEGRRFTDAAIEADPRQFVALFNRGAISLASGDVNQAKLEYEEALDRTLQSFDKKRISGTGLANLRSGALTDLELVALYGRPDVVDDVQAVRDRIVTKMSPAHEAGPSPTHPERLAAAVEPGLVQVNVEDVGGRRDEDWIAAEWYRLPERAISWVHLRDVSGPQQLFTSGRDLLSSRKSTDARDCLGEGRYRVDLYSGGRLIGQAVTHFEGGFKPVWSHDAGLVGCVPDSWEEAGGDTAHPVRRYVSRDGSAGLLVVRLDTLTSGPIGKSEAVRAMGPVLAAIRRVLPSRPHSVAHDPFGFLSGPLSGRRLRYWYKGGQALAGIGADRDGSLVAAVVYGPRRFFDPDRVPDKIISSITVLSPSSALGQ
jgi:tetratricopeptide (TPR) repeat protein